MSSESPRIIQSEGQVAGTQRFDNPENFAGPGSRRATLWYWACGALLLALTAVWSIRTGLLLSTDFGDSNIYYLPARVTGAEFYRSGHLPLWENHLTAGVPHAGTVLPGDFYPLNPLLYAFMPGYVAFNLSMVLHFLLLGYFTWRYLEVIGIRRYATLLGVIAVTLSGYCTVHKEAAPIFDAMVWIPPLFYCFEKWLRTDRWKYCVWGGACLAMQLLSGWAVTLPLSACYLTLYAFFALPEARNRTRMLLGLLLIFVVSAALVLPQAVETLDFKKATHLAAISLPEFKVTAYPPALMIVLLFPFFFGATEANFFTHSMFWGPLDFALTSIYCGILPVLLSIAAFGLWKKSRLVRFSICTLVLSAWISFLTFTPLGRLLYHLPVFGYFRDEWTNFAFFTFAMAILAAIAVQYHFSPDSEARPTLWLKSTPIILIAITTLILARAKSIVRLLAAQSVNVPGNWIVYFNQTVKLKNPAIMLPVVFILLACGLFYCWIRRPKSRALSILAAVMLVADLLVFAYFPVPLHTSAIPSPSEAAILKTITDPAGQPYRVMALTPGHAHLRPNSGSAEGFSDIQGLQPFLAYPYADMLSMNTGGRTGIPMKLLVNNRILSLLGTRYIVLGPDAWEQARTLLNLGDEVAPTASPGPNIFPSARLMPFGKVKSIGETSSFAAPPDQVVGLTVDGIPVEPNGVYELRFDVRVDGKPESLGGMVGRNDRRDLFWVTSYALSQQFSHYSYLYFTDAKADPVTVTLYTASPDTIYVRDITFRRIESLPADAGVYRVAQRSGELTLLENRKALPRAFFVNTVRPVPTYLEARSILHSLQDNIDLRSEAIVSSNEFSKTLTLDQGTVQQLQYGPNEVDLRTQCAGRCFMVLSDSALRSWQATIDGSPTPIYLTDGIVRGIFVPAGAHEVRFRFKTPFLNPALFVAALGLLLLVGVTIMPSRTSD